MKIFLILFLSLMSFSFKVCAYDSTAINAGGGTQPGGAFTQYLAGGNYGTPLIYCCYNTTAVTTSPALVQPSVNDGYGLTQIFAGYSCPSGMALVLVDSWGREWCTTISAASTTSQCAWVASATCPAYYPS